MWQAAENVTEFLVDLILPPRCLVCGADIYIDQVGASASKLICPQCQPESDRALTFGLRPIETQPQFPLSDEVYLWCECCGELSSPNSLGSKSERKICAHCFFRPPSYRHFRSLWRYSPTVEDVLKALKYGRRFGLIDPLAQKLVSWLSSESPFPNPNWDLIIPMPSSPDVLRNRGFGHVALLARRVAKSLGVAVDCLSLSTLAPYPPQASQPIERRWINVRNRFVAKNGFCSGKQVLLLDDICTTSASLEASTRALMNADAVSVDVATFSRSYFFHQRRAAANVGT